MPLWEFFSLGQLNDLKMVGVIDGVVGPIIAHRELRNTRGFHLKVEPPNRVDADVFKDEVHVTVIQGATEHTALDGFTRAAPQSLV